MSGAPKKIGSGSRRRWGTILKTIAMVVITIVVTIVAAIALLDASRPVSEIPPSARFTR